MRDVLARVQSHIELADLDSASRRLAVRSILAREGLNGAGVVQTVADALDGVGPLGPLLRDEAVTDVLVNGPDEVWVERDGRLELTGCTFGDEESLRGYAERWLAQSGARADWSEPIGDGTFLGGARINVIVPPVARSTLVSIRKFPAQRPTLADLTRMGMLSRDLDERLRRRVAERSTIAVTGRTGTGKTTLVNALLGEVPDDERVVVVEDTPELQPLCRHRVMLCVRRSNSDGRGEVALLDLIRTAMRMRPDRIVVGEIRGGEALAALNAFATGHDGSMITMHARSAEEAVERAVMLALQAGTATSERALRRQWSAAFDVVIHLERVGADRRVACVHER